MYPIVTTTASSLTIPLRFLFDQKLGGGMFKPPSIDAIKTWFTCSEEVEITLEEENMLKISYTAYIQNRELELLSTSIFGPLAN